MTFTVYLMEGGFTQNVVKYGWCMAIICVPAALLITYASIRDLIYQYDKGIIRKYGTMLNGIVTNKYDEEHLFHTSSPRHLNKSVVSSKEIIFFIEYEYHQHGQRYEGALDSSDNKLFELSQVGDVIPLQIHPDNPATSFPRKRKYKTELKKNRTYSA